jgi:hypothetical protein
MNKQLKQALDMMFTISGKQPPKKESHYKKEFWFHKDTWTQEEQDKYIEWLSDYLKDNWEGIARRKPTTKKERDKVANEFVFNYGLKVK